MGEKHGFFKIMMSQKIASYFFWMNFISNEWAERAHIFSIKPYYHTQTLDIVVWIMKKEYLGENNLTQKITYF